MQLSSLVDYHRALSDPARLRILFLLTRGSMNGLELAEKLGLSPPTVSHHMVKLREAGLVKEWREGNSIRFIVDSSVVSAGAEGIEAFLASARGFEEVEKDLEVLYERERSKVLKAFINTDGRLKQLPARYKRRLIILEEIASRLEPGRKYAEPEVNEVICSVFEDYASIRRYMIENHMLYRDKGVYELNPREMWVDWRKIK